MGATLNVFDSCACPRARVSQGLLICVLHVVEFTAVVMLGCANEATSRQSSVGEQSESGFYTEKE